MTSHQATTAPIRKALSRAFDDVTTLMSDLGILYMPMDSGGVMRERDA